MPTSVFRIAHRIIGARSRCFVIAEAGVNHNGDLDSAKELVNAAKEAGADAVKFQTFKTEKLVTQTALKAPYQKQNTKPNESQYKMLRRLELSEKAHRILMEHCKKRNILFLSSPFDEESADLLDRLGVPAFKIGSGEVSNLPFLSYVARRGKPVILSTGMSYLKEVGKAVQTIRKAGCTQLALLHCVSNYPADPADANLRALHTLAKEFKTPVGFSDHTPGVTVALAAAAMGACILEKHLTLDRKLLGPDHEASLLPNELKQLIAGVRVIKVAMGHGRKVPARSEVSIKAVARRSLVSAREIPAGTVLTEDLIAIKRPGTGLPPSMQPLLIGRKAIKRIPADALLSREMIR